MKRACLVRELQLLFLHIMGEARDCPLGPGMEVPPPLQKNASILAEVCQESVWPFLYLVGYRSASSRCLGYRVHVRCCGHGEILRDSRSGKDPAFRRMR